MKQSDLMQDRHLDQIVMSAVYVICKVSFTIKPTTIGSNKFVCVGHW